MTTSTLLSLAIPFIFILMAIFFVYIALKTLISRRPVILSSRWLFAFMCLTFLPSIAHTVSLGFSSTKGLVLITWLNPLMLSVLLVFFWIQMKGYIAFAISDSYFREALLASSATLGFSIEETMSRLKIKETGQEMQVAIQGWTGTAQLKAVGKDSDGSVRQIARGMINYFQNTPGKMNYLISYFYLIIGAFIVAIAIGMFALRLKLKC